MDQCAAQNDRSLWGRTLAATAFIFLLLEIWRPHFFLTDDNLTGGLGFFNEVGRHLLAGRSPFTSDYLFGGNYNYLRDPTFFSWHPVYLLASLLAGTPFRFWIIDVDAFAFLLLTAGGFIVLATYLRREYALRAGDGWLLFYTLSFTYSMISLTTGASWLTFLGVESALPWLALGIVHRDQWRGIVCIGLACVSQLLGGHPTVIISSTLFLTVFAVGVSLSRRSWQPVLGWAIGYGLALLVVSPLLVPMVAGFLSSARAGGVPLDDMQSNNIPANLFPTSFFLGMALWIVNPPLQPFTTYTFALSSCAAAWCLLPALVGRGRWRGLPGVTLVTLLFAVLMVCRPVWISRLMLHLPLLRAMRWPFRELIELQFFFHLFLVLRRPGFSPVIRRAIACFSIGIYLIPMALYMLPPTLNAMSWDRRLIISGDFDRYWARVRPLLQPGDRIAVIIPWKIYHYDRFEEPYSLLSTHNYSALSQVVNVWGWSQTAPYDQLYAKTISFYPFGAYLPSQRAKLLAEHPDLKIITLESLQPLKITLSSLKGPVIDLTPLVPETGRQP